MYQHKQSRVVRLRLFNVYGLGGCVNVYRLITSILPVDSQQEKALPVDFSMSRASPYPPSQTDGADRDSPHPISWPPKKERSLTPESSSPPSDSRRSHTPNSTPQLFLVQNEPVCKGSPVNVSSSSKGSPVNVSSSTGNPVNSYHYGYHGHYHTDRFHLFISGWSF